MNKTAPGSGWNPVTSADRAEAHWDLLYFFLVPNRVQAATGDGPLFFPSFPFLPLFSFFSRRLSNGTQCGLDSVLGGGQIRI